MALEFVYPLSADKNKGLYNELECRSLQLGDRVRRGPNWMHEEQDSGRVGTVVGQDQDSKPQYIKMVKITNMRGIGI